MLTFKDSFGASESSPDRVEVCVQGYGVMVDGGVLRITYYVDGSAPVGSLPAGRPANRESDSP
jgi:hypothetical protein